MRKHVGRVRLFTAARYRALRRNNIAVERYYTKSVLAVAREPNRRVHVIDDYRTAEQAFYDRIENGIVSQSVCRYAETALPPQKRDKIAVDRTRFKTRNRQERRSAVLICF